MLAFGHNAPHDLVITVVYPQGQAEPIPLERALSEEGLRWCAAT